MTESASMGGAEQKRAREEAAAEAAGSSTPRKAARSEATVEEDAWTPGKSAEAAGPAAPEAPGGLGALVGCVKTLEQAVNGTFARMSGSLANSVAVMKSMNGMMEEYVKRSLELSARAVLRSSGPVAEVFVRNGARLPVPECSVKVECLGPDDSEPLLLIEEKRGCLDPEQEERWEAPLPATRAEVGEVTTLLVTVSFPSPGTGDLLVRTNRSPVFMRDLITFRAVGAATDSRPAAAAAAAAAADGAQAAGALASVSLDAPASAVRDYLGVDPVKGLLGSYACTVAGDQVAIEVGSSPQAGSVAVTLSGSEDFCPRLRDDLQAFMNR